MPASHARGAARRQASEEPRRRKPRGEYAPAAVSVYGDFRRGSARLGRSRTEHWLEWVAGSVILVAAASSRPTSSGLRTTGRRRGLRVEMSSSARSWRFSVILKKNRSAVALTLAVPTDVPIEASHN